MHMWVYTPLVRFVVGLLVMDKFTSCVSRPISLQQINKQTNKWSLSHAQRTRHYALVVAYTRQEGLAVASIAQDVVVEMTPPRDDNAR